MAGESEDTSQQPSSPHNESSTASEINLKFLRQKVQKYIEMHLHQAAIFWADKVATLSNEDPSDIYWLAQSYYYSGQYHRAANCIISRNLHKVDLDCRYLAAKCHYAGKAYKEALDVLNFTDTNLANTSNRRTPKILEMNADEDITAAVLVLQGQIHEAMDNRGLASECYRDAIIRDVFCYDAFDSLVQHQMMTKEEEFTLVESLPFDFRCPVEYTAAKHLYTLQLKKYNKPSELKIPSELSLLESNLDVGTALAERCYYNCDYTQCFNITKKILKKDPFHLKCLPIHISCLMELEKSTELFYLGHKLIDLYPENSVSWYAVGCYYLHINKTDAARRYLSKATTLDRVYGPAWLMYGHSFAMENEHDQAMAAYCRASQLMKGCHLPLLYIGLEYGLSNNSKLAERFFTQARSIAPEDPFVLHELGVVAFQNVEYDTAYVYFEEALHTIQTGTDVVLPEKWEPLLNNMAHTCRKLKKYEEALSYHEQALILLPQNPSTFASIGFVYSLMSKWSEAVEYFHKALGLQRDDVFSNTMLNTVIELLSKETTILDVCDDIVLPSLDTINPGDVSANKIITEIVTDDFQTINDQSNNSAPSMEIEDGE